MERIYTDFLVIGSGVAGLRAAIELSRHGHVLVVTKDELKESATEYAQGGVAVALSDEDEVGIHFTDTIMAGDGLCREEAVKILVESGPGRILELIEWGAQFDKVDNKLDFAREAAHSRRRILHACGDSTGRELERVLVEKTKSLEGIRILPFSTASDLIIDKGACAGATVLRGTDFTNIYAKATLLATGGAGHVFSRTTNPDVSTGDGMALAFRASAVLEDMEFVQFHPTALFLPSAPQFLLSEAMRGEGALLRDVNGELFMRRYHPDAELAPRDVVSRAIISQIVETRSSHVYLDLTHLDKGFVKKRFPKIFETCLKYDLDITRDPIPVSPAAHYIMGGVKTDLEGATNIPGLYAAGEVACTGVHGANRIASNSLLEGLVFGYRSAIAAARYGPLSGDVAAHAKPGMVFPDTIPDRINLSEVRATIRRTMWERAGIIRCAESLGFAREQFSEFKEIMRMNFGSRAGIEIKNMLTVAVMITEAALARKGSVGGHYRSDMPQKGDNWQQHTNIVRSGDEVKVTWAEH